MHHEEGHVFQALRAGARGYLLKTSRVSEVAGAVRAVASGLSLLDPSVTSSVVSEFKRMSSKQTPEDGLGQLTETEVKILQHVSAGMSNKEIANKLSLAESTVKNRLSVLFEKIGVLDRTQAAIYAITHGIAPTAVQSQVSQACSLLRIRSRERIHDRVLQLLGIGHAQDRDVRTARPARSPGRDPGSPARAALGPGSRPSSSCARSWPTCAPRSTTDRSRIKPPSRYLIRAGATSSD